MAQKFPALLFLCLLGFDMANFLLQKTASTHAAAATAAAGASAGDESDYLRNLLTHPWMWLALATAPLHLWTWTQILSRVDISLAQPLTSLSYPLTLLAAVVLLRENLGWQVWLGAFLITAGAVIMSMGKGGAVHRSPAEGDVAPPVHAHS